MCLRILGWAGGNRALLGAAEFRLQSVGDFARDFAFDRKDISQLAIILIGPKMRIVPGVDELDIYSNLTFRFLNRALENSCDAELLRNFRQVFRRTLETLRRGARDYFEITDL